MTHAADWSYARPDPRSIRAAGYSVALRYLGRDGRCITSDELRRLLAAGIKVALIGQSTILRPLTGFPGGQRDAWTYNALADELDPRPPDWLPIFYVCDVGTQNGRSFPQTGDYPVIADYVRGILAESRRPVGFYGPYPVLEFLQDVEWNGRRVFCWWQTAGASGSGHGTGGSIRTGDGSWRRLSGLACMFQHYGYPSDAPAEARAFGTSIDHNTILMQPVTWAWHPDEPEGDDMPLNENDLNQIRAIVAEAVNTLGEWEGHTRRRTRLVWDYRGEQRQAYFIFGPFVLALTEEYAAWAAGAPDVWNDEKPITEPEWRGARIDSGVRLDRFGIGPVELARLAATLQETLGSVVEEAAARGVDRELDGLAD